MDVLWLPGLGCVIWALTHLRDTRMNLLPSLGDLLKVWRVVTGHLPTHCWHGYDRGGFHPYHGMDARPVDSQPQ